MIDIYCPHCGLELTPEEAQKIATAWASIRAKEMNSIAAALWNEMLERTGVQSPHETTHEDPQ